MLNLLQKDILDSIPTTSCCSNAFLSAVISLTKEEVCPSKIVLNCPKDIYNKVEACINNFYPQLNIKNGDKLVIAGDQIIEMLSELGLAEFDGSKLESTNSCNEDILFNECCKITYIKAVFLCVGKMYYNDDSLKKSSGYNLEFVFKNYQLADDIFALTKYLHLNLKRIKRGNNIVLYSKDSQVLIKFLVMVGANSTAFELQNNLVMREIRNDANRKGNCFDANLNKTINASAEQVKAIDYIINNYGLDYLDASLQEVALLRLSNPESTLSELQQLYSTPITRAGLKYKLDRILEIYKKVKE